MSTPPYRSLSSFNWWVQGVEIRDLKDKSADKATLQPHIDELLSIKAQHRQLMGAVDAPASGAEGSNVEEIRAQIVNKVGA